MNPHTMPFNMSSPMPPLPGGILFRPLIPPVPTPEHPNSMPRRVIQLPRLPTLVEICDKLRIPRPRVSKTVDESSQQHAVTVEVMINPNNWGPQRLARTGRSGSEEESENAAALALIKEISSRYQVRLVDLSYCEIQDLKGRIREMLVEEQAMVAEIEVLKQRRAVTGEIQLLKQKDEKLKAALSWLKDWR